MQKLCLRVNTFMNCTHNREVTGAHENVLLIKGNSFKMHRPLQRLLNL
jgi:hypothetical protein